jgi:hypothetical protein
MSLATLAFLAASLVPAQPTSFDTVVLRISTDACNFGADTVRVTMSANVIRVTRGGENCSPPGPPIMADVQLGALPAGDYRVETHSVYDPAGPASETIAFQVRDPVEVAVFPPPPRPVTDYTGLWFNPAESGWGLSLHQGATHNMFGLFFVYDANGQPEWYSLQGGRWNSSTSWSATIFRTTGPTFLTGAFDPTQVHYVNAGQAQIEFRQSPGEEGMARFTYTVNGVSAARTIRRMAL